MMFGPPINVASYDPKAAGFRWRADGEQVACHIELFPIQVEPFDNNDVKITIDGVSRVVDAFALGRAMDMAIQRFRGR